MRKIPGYAGSIETDMEEMVSSQTWTRYCSGKKDYWEYIDFGSKRKTWDRFRRAIYCRLINADDQIYLAG
ncbi:MAG: hypothetical protein GY797_22170 [Deltaproteobacteria bacterium]|nr:hypothetical protein [Deltaproteobacteria bacterium]